MRYLETIKHEHCFSPRVRLAAPAPAFVAGGLPRCFRASPHAEVTVKDAWVRGTVPAQTATGAFMTLTSTEDAKVVARQVAGRRRWSRSTTSTMKGNVMQMHAVEALPLPAGKAVELKAGGYHVMLMGLAKPLGEGRRVPITLHHRGRGRQAHARSR